LEGGLEENSPMNPEPPFFCRSLPRPLDVLLVVSSPGGGVISIGSFLSIVDGGSETCSSWSKAIISSTRESFTETFSLFSEVCFCSKPFVLPSLLFCFPV
jgi:hypothetical protein